MDNIGMEKMPFDISISGTSHGPGVTALVENCPEGIVLDYDFIDLEMARRRPGQKFTSARRETDEYEIRSGVDQTDTTTGDTLEIFIPNTNQNPRAYNKLQNILRPGHGITPQMIRDPGVEQSGGGQASARLTAGNVAVGAVAQLGMDQLIGHPVPTLAYVSDIGELSEFCFFDLAATMKNEIVVEEDWIYESPVRCPDPEASREMEELLRKLMREGDSVGGKVQSFTQGFPPYVGERPGVNLDGRLAGAILGINGVKGATFGATHASEMRGSIYLDRITGYSQEGGIESTTNHEGGILGGLSTGRPILIQVEFKPTSSIKQSVKTVDLGNNPCVIELGPEDRHDPCIAIRGVEVVKAVVRTTLFQAWLEHKQLHP